jgi:heme oxygenase
MAEKRVIELEIKTNSKKVEKDLKDFGDASKKTSKSVDNLGNSATKSNEKFGAFNDMKSAITGLSAWFRSGRKRS